MRTRGRAHAQGLRHSSHPRCHPGASTLHRAVAPVGQASPPHRGRQARQTKRSWYRKRLANSFWIPKLLANHNRHEQPTQLKDRVTVTADRRGPRAQLPRRDPSRAQLPRRDPSRAHHAPGVATAAGSQPVPGALRRHRAERPRGGRPGGRDQRDQTAAVPAAGRRQQQRVGSGRSGDGRWRRRSRRSGDAGARNGG